MMGTMKKILQHLLSIFLVTFCFTGRGSTISCVAYSINNINSSLSTKATTSTGSRYQQLTPVLEAEAKHSDVSVTRNNFVRKMLVATTAAFPLFSSVSSQPSNAAPPFAIMAEELGYFPVTDERTGETVMVPAKAKRESTDQAVALAKHLKATKGTMYGAFWCPHCQRQKELFGKEAWSLITYVECSPKGYKSQFATCIDAKVDGYPTWTFGNGKIQGGEMELIDIAKTSGYGKPFDASLEVGVPSLGGGGCK
jgi:hypothetical protein